MRLEKLESITFDKSDTVRKVLESFNKTAKMTESRGFGVVLDENRVLLGVVSDGDIRRKIVKGLKLEDPISKVMKRDFVFATKNNSPHQILRFFDSRILNLPIVDDQRRLIGLHQFSDFKASSYSVPRIIRARVPSRVSFSGGGTDLSHLINRKHSFVLSSTIDKYCTATILPRDDKKIHIISKEPKINIKLNDIDEISYNGELDLIKSAIKLMQPNFGFDLEFSSEIEIGTGLGGSSAMVVAVIGVLNSFRNENQLDLYQIADLAYQSERIEIGIDGGWQDQYTTTFGGFNWIEFRKDEVLVHPLRLQRETLLELEYNTLLFRVGNSHNSGIIQKKMLEKIKTKKVQKFSESMTNTAIQMKESLVRGKVKQFGDLLHESWEWKKAINQNVTTPLIDKCYLTARNLGALGGKLLGAGKHGYMLIYASPHYQSEIQESLEKLGCIKEPFHFSKLGLEVWSTVR